MNQFELTPGAHHASGFDIYDYTDAVEYLNAVHQDMRARNASFSLRSWAKQMGLPHASMLSMVLGRQRKLQPTLSSRIGDSLKKLGRLDAAGARYLDLLVLFNNARGDEEKSFYAGILSSLRPDRSFSTLELDRVRAIADWWHFAVLEMTHLKGFQSDPRWISRRLGGSVNSSQVQEALDRLLRLGLLEKTEKGALKRTDVRLVTPTDRPDESLRKLHRQLIAHASEAIERQRVERRDVTAYVVATKRDRIPEAKRMIREFRQKLGKFLDVPSGEANTVYLLNVQLVDMVEEEEVLK